MYYSFYFLFLIFFILIFHSSFAMSKIIVKCNFDKSEIYINNSLKAKCFSNSTVIINTTPGDYNIKVISNQENGIKYVFEKKIKVYDNIELNIPVHFKKIYTELYYWLKAKNSSNPYNYEIYLKKFPHGKYSKEAKSFLKSVSYVSVSKQIFINTDDGYDNKIRYAFEFPNETYLIGTRYYLYKIDKDGRIIWKKYVKDLLGVEDFEIISGININNRFYFVGDYYESETGKELIFSIDSNGKLLHKKFIYMENIHSINSILFTKDKKFLLVGKCQGSDIYNGIPYEDICIIKLDSNLDKLWGRIVPNSPATFDNGFHAVELNKGYVVLGYIQPYKDQHLDGIVIFLSKDGNIIWKTNSDFGDMYDATLHYGIKDKDAIIAAGYSGYYYGLLTKINKDGKFVWTKKFPGEGVFTRIHSILKEKDIYLVPVVIHTFDGKINKIHLYMINNKGKVLWKKLIKLQNCSVDKPITKNLIFEDDKHITIFTYCWKKNQSLMIKLKKF